MLVWKGLLTLAVFVLFVLISFAVPEDDHSLKAATYALLASVTLFVGLIDASGELHGLLVLFLSLTGGFATFLTAWYWMLSAGGAIPGFHRIVVIAILILLLAALFTPLVLLRRSLGPRGGRDQPEG